MEGERQHRSGDSQAVQQLPNQSARFRPQWGFPGGAALSVPDRSGTTDEGSASQAVRELPLLRERRPRRAWFFYLQKRVLMHKLRREKRNRHRYQDSCVCESGMGHAS